jgi:hypothetical protein
MRKRLTLLSVVAIAISLLVGCAGGGGPSGGSTGASSTTSGSGGVGGGTGGSTGSGSGSTSTSSVPPVLTITSPARASYPTQAQIVVRGTAIDPAAGIATLTVNGGGVAVDPQGNWQAPITLVPGVNVIVAHATDGAGNVSETSVAVMYGDWSPPSDDISGFAETRFNQATLDKIAAIVSGLLANSGVIQAQLANGPIQVVQTQASLFGLITLASVTVDITNVTYDPPQLQLSTVQNGLHAVMHVPNLDVYAEAKGTVIGIGYDITGDFGAADAVIDMVLDVSVDPQGNYQVSCPSASDQLNGFHWGINGFLGIFAGLLQSTVQKEATSRLHDAIVQNVPSLVQNELQNLSQPITRSFLGQNVTLQAVADQISFDAAGLTVDFRGNVTTAQAPGVPPAPGSWVAPGAGQPPVLGGAQGFYASLGEEALNRALFASWQGGFWSIAIDQQFLQQFGANVPLSLNGQLLALFFPSLAGALGSSSQQVPLQIVLDPQMQPLAIVEAGQDIMKLEIGELDVLVQVDVGGGFQTMFAVAIDLEAPIGISLAGGNATFSLGSSTSFHADLVASALPLNGIDVANFLNLVMPAVLQAAASSIAPVPIPTIQGLTLANLSIYQDGAAGDYVTVSGNVQ